MKHVLSFFSWLSVLLMWLCAATVFVSPASAGGYWAVLSLCFPVFVATTLVMAVVCLLFKPRLALVSVLGMLLCAGSLRDYFPLNLSSPPPRQALKVITYNTLSLGSWQKDDTESTYAVLRYITSQRPDLACLQEVAYKAADGGEDYVTRHLRHQGYHFEAAQVGGNKVALVSRWPILRKEIICHSVGNGAAAFWVSPRAGDTLIVVNAHLESMHLSQEQRSTFHSVATDPSQIENVHGKLQLLRSIAHSSALRATQADTLGQFIDRHANEPLLLMGDFNDTPISYVHHQVCSRLTDCYRASGNGLGRSFNRDAIWVRIDNLFCSAHFKPFAAQVDATVPFSDHYPLVGYVVRR